MASTLKGKVPAYLDQYARTLGAAYRVEAIRRDIASEQDQVRYIDSLISQAQNTAAGLEAALQAQPPASLETATALLKEQYDAENAGRTRRAGEGLAARRSVELSAEDRAAFTVGRNQGKHPEDAGVHRALEFAQRVRPAGAPSLRAVSGDERREGLLLTMPEGDASAVLAVAEKRLR